MTMMLFLSFILSFTNVALAQTVDFTADKTEVYPGEVVTFTDQSTGYSAYYTREWDFQGGSPSTATGTQAMVIYNAPGSYDVTLRIKDPAYGTVEGQETKTAYIIVFEPPELDFGDAPDPTYPTLFSNQGAGHYIVQDFYLGVRVDSERDGQPNADATGDDTDGSDDDDGVAFTTVLKPNKTARVDVTASGEGFLNAWIDFTGDGDWDDSGEQIFTNQSLSGCVNALTFFVPAASLTGYTFARFRFSTSADLTPIGDAPDGEVEDYQVRIVETDTLDFGDAPDPKYPTLLASDGARHVMSSIHLGYYIDAESDGHPNDEATGDNIDHENDEEGVFLPSLMKPGNTYNAEVITSGDGYLNGWIDFNGDGDWDDTNEKVYDAIYFSGSPYHEVPFTVPDDAVAGYTYARFRYSSNSNLTYKGYASDGEVEDYRVEIAEEDTLDFGDAPDDYFTTLDNNGACHPVSFEVYLGHSLPDVETDGQPSPMASGDDDHGNDDEDGVIFLDPLIPGQRTDLEVTLHNGGNDQAYLYIWVDYNRNGNWDDPGEMLFNGANLGSGTHSGSMTIPLDAVLGDTYMRLRYSLDPPPFVYYGLGATGEVEDYLVNIVRGDSLDYGDAPDDNNLYYPTLLSHDGARHLISDEIYLGSDVDNESDGQPGIGATGDDLNGRDDEDGMTIPNLIPGQYNRMTVTAHGDGYLWCWIDFNRDGDWDDPGECINDHFIAHLIDVIDYPLHVDITADADTGYTYARFRFVSSPKPLSHDGIAVDGEVEDYRIYIEGQELDFGDAPDDQNFSYPTLLINDGPRHGVNEYIYLGYVVDGEDDGQPSVDADGDGYSDDGISTPANWVPGQTYNPEVRTTGDGYLNGWADFNGDGDWDDPGEHIYQNVYLSGGFMHNVPFTVPLDARPGNTYARFRYSTDSYLTCTGYARDGEVEDYKIYIPASQFDFGDAPDTGLSSSFSELLYPTLLSRNGASHPISDRIYLGGSVDGEYDGLPNKGATGDDLNNNDDEDGVFIPDLVPGQIDTIRVTVHGQGHLNGWIDFNADYDWDDPDENIIYARVLTDGTHFITVNVPSNAVEGYTYARFRYSYDTSIGYTYRGYEGEVEDYRVRIMGQLYDFGDAPDNNYKTLLSSDGACHPVSDQIYLGTSVDDEPDGQPNGDATGDDLNGSDDEDGVVILELIQNQTPYIQVTTHGAGVLHGWIDLNIDGDWDDQGEKCFYSHVTSGTHILQGQGIGGLVGDTYARFRYCPDEDIGPGGFGAAGEVEDYRVEIQGQGFDFGDAPDDESFHYHTLIANEGAFHPISDMIYLGALVDPETDGQPSSEANGDDLGNTDDEDGVVIPVLVPGQTASLQVATHGAATFRGWIDFNRDGDWDDEGELLFGYWEIPLNEGIHTVSFEVPSDAVEGPTYARFRYSNDYWLGPYGPSDHTGEIEDYKVRIGGEQYDFGDAPDDETFHYTTLLANDGARYNISAEHYLGSSIDGEDDGQPTSNANGDDVNGNDDEDGVIIPVLLTGKTARLTVIVHVPYFYFLNGWIDFNADGDWDEFGEHIIEMEIDDGTHTLNVNIPSDAVTGYTYARFRLGSQSGEPYWGIGAGGGEIEDYRVLIAESTLDFGDAPDDAPFHYPTRLEDDGACHASPPQIFLGTRRDSEHDGQPNSDATGDDVRNDDEEGVVIPPLFIGQTVNIDVTAHGAGYLNGWIDFNADGDWADDGEHVFQSEKINWGTQTLTVTVPYNAAKGNTFARFRFSTEKNLSFSGHAPDGEVEDYQVQIMKPLYDYGDAPEGPSFHYSTQHVSNGACHPISEAIYLGSLVDDETDAIFDFNATGDDLDDLDDDDGVLISELIPGQKTTIQVTAHGQGYLHGWIDFNRDGDWNDQGEKIISGVLLNDGTHDLPVGVPYNAEPGPTFARFRYSYDKRLDSGGLASFGEVEDYEVIQGEIEYDFGDAPDDTSFSYPTSLANNGARHPQSENIYLGTAIDTERDGFQTLDALGDDSHNIDDEDGVVIPLLIPDQSANIVVTVHGIGYLWGWIDFNRDGDWDDWDENIFSPEPLISGTHTLTVNVHSRAVTGDTYARFRYCTWPELVSYDGFVTDGEVEDYKVFIGGQGLDFGDAPDNSEFHYPTLLDNNGAGHPISDSVYIGSAPPDSELDGQPSTNGDGDDTHGDDDEDGIVIPDLMPGQTSTIQVTVHGRGSLWGWIDFNRDGDWDDSNESIFRSITLTDGTYSLNVNIPLFAVTGHTYARFRYGTWFEVVDPYGISDAGEVEDYKVHIQGPEFDFGDAPDDSVFHYQTLLSNNGAGHAISDEIYLGSQVDGEPDGQPNENADGDDTHGADDDDGVVIPELIQGQTTSIQVTVHGEGDLWGWIDFNQDGYWDDSNECVFNSIGLTDGTHSLQVRVPSNADPGHTYARFRYGAWPEVIAPYRISEAGEVEDYKVFIQGQTFDFGDAPDDETCHYPTLLMNNGAQHRVDEGYCLGSTVDGEYDGRPNDNASGDDISGSDDEDGVVIPVLSAGETDSIRVTVTGWGFFHGWFDFNGDGDWSDSGETVFNHEFLSGGTHSLPVTVPWDAVQGHTYARFRLTLSTSPIFYTGDGGRGEVEDYRVLIEGPGLDFGDAPDPNYPTLLARNGARHRISDQVYLGSSIDGESDGKPNGGASGDDLIHDDEDGVVIPVLMRGQQASLEVTTVNTSGMGFLFGWIDFNANGDWEDSGELVVHDTGCDNSGTFMYSINVPDDAVPGYTYARFRYSSEQALNCYGYSDDGEVEDYKVLIESSETGVEEIFSDERIPLEFALLQNYPNPFNPQTTIAYQLPQTADVSLTIYDLKGVRVRTLIYGPRQAGYHKILWDGRDVSGQVVATGMYFYRIEVKTMGAGQSVYSDVKKMIFMK